MAAKVIPVRRTVFYPDRFTQGRKFHSVAPRLVSECEDLGVDVEDAKAYAEVHKVSIVEAALRLYYGE